MYLWGARLGKVRARGAGRLNAPARGLCQVRACGLVKYVPARSSPRSGHPMKKAPRISGPLCEPLT